MPSESNFDHAAVSQEGGCQLNHLYGGVIHPWSLPQPSKRSILKRARANCHVTCLSVYSSGGLQPFPQLFRGVYRYTAQPPRPAPLAEVYSSTAVYSDLQYTALQQSTVYSGMHSPSGPSKRWADPSYHRGFFPRVLSLLANTRTY